MKNFTNDSEMIKEATILIIHIFVLISELEKCSKISFLVWNEAKV